MPCATFGCSLLALLFAVGPIYAMSISVPLHHPTIQSAIEAAADGDVIEVAPGTYNENLDFLGKAIHVVGTGGPIVTMIRGNQIEATVVFRNGEQLDSILEGFSIVDGFNQAVDPNAGGGAIHCAGTSPTLWGNVFMGNLAHWNGGAIYAENSDVLVVNNQFFLNGFACLITDAPCGVGGAIHCRGGSPTLRGNFFQANEGPYFGGAIACTDTVGAVLEDNVLIANRGGKGGGIALLGDAEATITNALFARNDAFGHISFAGPGAGEGGGIYVGPGAGAALNHATIADGGVTDGVFGPGQGGGAFAATGSQTVTVTNSIIWGNLTNSGAQLSGDFTVSYSNIQGTAPGVGNLDRLPQFAIGTEGEYYLSQVSAGQPSTSSCVDAGDPGAPTLGSRTSRTDGLADDGVVDMGFHYRTTPIPLELFRRSECNGDGAINIADVIFVLGYLFPVGGSPPNAIGCQDACDANDNGVVNLADAVAMLNLLFGSNPAPTPPPGVTCGPDPTSDGADCAVPSC